MVKHLLFTPSTVNALSSIMLLVDPSLSLPAPLSLGLPPSHAHIISAIFTSAYVGSLYISQLLLSPRYIPDAKTTPTPDLVPISASDDEVFKNSNQGPVRGSRDHPDTIKWRMRAVGTATVGSVLCVGYITKTLGHYDVVASVSIPKVTTKCLIRRRSGLL
jgi:prenyl protein peptidase